MYTHIKRKIITLILRQTLKLHTKTYNFANRLIASKAFGAHPKHKIINYNKWFCDRVGTNDVVMDVGCHIGSTSFALSKKCKFVFGIDMDKKRILEAKKLHGNSENLTFECMDVTSDRFQKFVNEQFTLNNNNAQATIVLSNVLEHIEDRVNFLRKITSPFSNKKLRLLIRVPDINRDWIVLFKKQIGMDYLLDPTHFIEFTKAELLSELHESNIVLKTYENKFGEHYLECVYE